MTMRNRCILLALLTLALSLTAQAQTPAIATSGTVNAADYSRDFAPGAIVSIFGTNLAASSGGATSIPLPTTLGGATVEMVDGSNVQSLPLFYVSPAQINAELPYGVTSATVGIRVRTSAGVSATDTITLKARAPKIFTVDFSGKGSVMATDPQYKIISQGNPVKPGDVVTIWANSLGATIPAVVAGSAAPSAAPAVLSDAVTVTIGGKTAQVLFAGAAPGFSGLYQINVKAPFVVLTGPTDVQVSVLSNTSQASVSAAYRQLGFYNTVVGGKAVAGQTVLGVDAMAFRQSDALAWGSTGLGAWARAASASINSTVSGLAVTLRNGSTTVYDNNGIEDATGASFYSNTGGGSDSTKPGLSVAYSMSNYFPLVFATYVHLTQATTVSELIGYFQGTGSTSLPFDPSNPYIKYRMNLWSNASGLPKENASFAGDVWTSDGKTGTFSVSKTSVSRISSSAAATPDPIWRLSFKPAAPVTLPAGDYWFEHDASIRDTPSSGTSTTSSITESELAQIIRMQPESSDSVTVSFFGRQMLYRPSWSLPFAVQVRPDAPIKTGIE